MRAFSRAVAGAGSSRSIVFGIGSDTWRCALGSCVQPASTVSSSGTTSQARRARSIRSVQWLATLLMCSVDQLDLFGRDRLDDRTAALLDGSAHPDAAALERFDVDTGGGKVATRALRDNDGEVPRPAPPEIQVDSGPALPHRQDSALNESEMPPRGRNHG